MATFSVVRALSQGKTQSFKHLCRLTLAQELDPNVQRHSSFSTFQYNAKSIHSLCLFNSRDAGTPNPTLKLCRLLLSSTSSLSFSPIDKAIPTHLHRLFSSSIRENDITNEKETAEVPKENSSDKDKDKKGKESWWRGKNSWRLGLIFLGGACISWGVGLINIWGAPLLDPDGNEVQDEYSDLPAALAYFKRTWKEMNIFKKKIQDPSREKLLPEPLTYPYMQPPYTLVLEMTGVLIHPDWTYSTGWRFKKRPGIEYFLSQVGPPLFEVVVYSSEIGMTADPLVNNLDPEGYVMYRLYRDATRYMDGHHVKDLSCLNRDLSKVIMLDCNDDSVKLQPRNSLVLKKWKGEDGDRTLIDLAHFLKTIASSGVEDVRPVIDYYSQCEDPLTAFRENQRKLQEEEESRAKFRADENKKKSWFSGFKK